eukprot:3844758-Pyramimonas_sp.AAC.1
MALAGRSGVVSSGRLNRVDLKPKWKCVSRGRAKNDGWRWWCKHCGADRKEMSAGEYTKPPGVWADSRDG